jgi:hypothetical protein
VSIAFTYSGLDGERCACTLLRLVRALVSTSYCSSYASNKPDEQRGIHQPRPTSIRNPSRKVPPTTRSSAQSRPWHRAPDHRRRWDANHSAGSLTDRETGGASPLDLDARSPVPRCVLRLACCVVALWVSVESGEFTWWPGCERVR